MLRQAFAQSGRAVWQSAQAPGRPPRCRCSWIRSFAPVRPMDSHGSAFPAFHGQEELERAGAYRVYEDPAGLLRHVDKVSIR
jgi:hypothetical protein